MGDGRGRRTVGGRKTGLFSSSHPPVRTDGSIRREGDKVRDSEGLENRPCLGVRYFSTLLPLFLRLFVPESFRILVTEYL